MKKILSYLIVVSLLFVIAPSSMCNATTKLSRSSLSLSVGSTAALKISGASSLVKWSSGNAKIATVSSFGKVTGKSVGKVNVVATVGKSRFICKVTVTAKKYTDGKYKIGSDIKSGEYVIFSSSDSGYFSLSSDANGDVIIANDNFAYNTIITVNDGEFLELSRAYAVAISDVSSLDSSKDGMFKVGLFLPAGEYKLDAGSSSGYFCVYSDNRQQDIVVNDNFKGISYVSVEDGQYLELVRCKIVY